MLAGGLSGAPCSTPGPAVQGINAVLFVVLDVTQFAGAGHFVQEVTQLAAVVRGCPRCEGAEEIQLPGDPERRERGRRRSAGIPLDDGTWGQLRDLAGRFGVSVPNPA